MSRSAILKRLQAIEQVVERRRAADIYKPASPSFDRLNAAFWQKAEVSGLNRYAYFLANHDQAPRRMLKPAYVQMAADPDQQGKLYLILTEGMRHE
ncbi:hypothetical protein [uncultured Paracoccus sp.]|uniref:hypothetical protein n=1 Tax=uncultured Paracoccus sp. TaxID=189685 RepID=UPI0030DBAC28